MARRLAAERIAMLIAVRNDPEFAARDLPEVRLRGLDHAAATALLAERYPELTAETRDRVIAETGGNPLALAELPAALTPSQRAGREPLLGPLPLPEHLQRIYLEQARGLRDATRTLLLVAAAEDSGELALALRAARDLGGSPDALEPAEEAGLVRVDDQHANQVIVFRHPLVRAAAYQSATFTGRLAAHRSLARALEPTADADRRAWHLAASATGPDERFAVELEEAGDRAIRRGGAAAGASALERAAWLTVDVGLRARRLVRAAEAANDAGAGPIRPRSSRGRRSGPAPRQWYVPGSAAFERRSTTERGSPATAHRLLLADAPVIAADEPELAASMLVDAVKNGWFMNDQARTRRAIESLAEVRLPTGSRLGTLVDTAVGLGILVGGETGHAFPQLQRGAGAGSQALRHAEPRHIAPSAAIATWARGPLDLGRGRPDEALQHLRSHQAATGHPLTALRQTPDLVEAAARAGRGDAAAAASARFEQWAVHGQAWAKDSAARCRALLTMTNAGDDEAVDRHFTEAMRGHRHADTSGRPRPFDRARTELAYGEWPRRIRRRADARGPLHAAAERFTRLGARP